VWSALPRSRAAERLSRAARNWKECSYFEKMLLDKLDEQVLYLLKAGRRKTPS
jgi:hypothetical protein